jgi:hypothetical protein
VDRRGYFFLTMADDKRINCVKVCFDDQAFIALGRMAAREDRKVADLVHLIVMRHMYGNYRRDPAGDEGTLGD